MKRTLIAALAAWAAAGLLAATATASTIPPLVVTGILEGATQTGGTLIVSVEATQRSFSTLRVDLSALGGELKTPAALPAFGLYPGVPVRLSIPITLAASKSPEETGSLVVRVLSPSGSPITTRIFHFIGRPGFPVAELSPADFEAILAKHAADNATVDANKVTARLVEATLARNKRPVPSTFGSAAGEASSSVAAASPSQAAWDRASTSLGPSPQSPPDQCGQLHQDADNYAIPVAGQAFYYDPHEQSTTHLAGGYTVAVDTQVLWSNLCDDQYRTTRYFGTTDDNGGYSMTVTSSVAPGTGNPLVSFLAEAPDAGVRSGNAGMIPITQSLLPGYHHGGWEGTTWRMFPLFDPANSFYTFLFRWNNEIKSLQSRWAESGFGSYYTPFKAGYDSSAQDSTAFVISAPGLVAFNTAGSYTIKWTMAHEFGHFFQYQLQGGSLDGGGQHSYCGNYGDAVAFVEGFADWHGAWWETDGINFIVPCDGGDCYGCSSAGWRLEGNVQAFFWDLFDAVNSSSQDGGVDTVTYPLNFLQNWNTYSSFPSFYSDFQGRGLFNSAVPAIRTVNKLDVPE